MALLELEFSILYFIQGLHTPFLDRFMTAVTSLGDKGWFFIVLGIILFVLNGQEKWGRLCCFHWQRAASSEMWF